MNWIVQAIKRKENIAVKYKPHVRRARQSSVYLAFLGLKKEEHKCEENPRWRFPYLITSLSQSKLSLLPKAAHRHTCTHTFPAFSCQLSFYWASLMFLFPRQRIWLISISATRLFLSQCLYHRSSRFQIIVRGSLVPIINKLSFVKDFIYRGDAL